MRRSTLLLLVGLMIGLLVGGGVAYAATSSKTVKVCVTSKNVVRSASSTGKCPAKTKSVSINKAGTTGKTGATGKTGPKGDKGDQGEAGPGTAGINRLLEETPTGTGQHVFDDPLISVDVVCTDSSITIFYEGSQGDHFTALQRRVLNGVPSTAISDNFSSTGAATASTSVSLDATIAKYQSLDTRELDLTVFRVDSNSRCRVFGRVTS